MASSGQERWTGDLVAARLSGLEPRVASSPTSETEGSWSLIEAASVLSMFDPMTLRPLDDDAPRVDSLQTLLAHSTPLFDQHGRPRWRLEAAARRDALERLGSRDAIVNACRRNESTHIDSLTRTFVEVLSGEPSPIESRSYLDLNLLMEVAGSLQGIVPDVPDPVEIQEALGRASLLEPLRQLVGAHFRGRGSELATLREYVGVLPPGSAIQSLKRTARAALRRHERDPLIVLGIGGIGKSTLLAKFILDHAEREHALAFTYLDFDRPEVSAAEPISILVEAAKQLAAQSTGTHQIAWSQAHSRWSDELARIQRAGGAASVDRSQTQRFIVADFAATMKQSFGDRLPYLLVLDTFEEVQFRSREFVSALWRFLDELQALIPGLRTVLAGRARVSERTTETLRLDGLDREAALGYLEEQSVSSDAATLLVDRLGCSPLTLRLVIDLMRRDECSMETIQELTLQQRLFVLALDHETTHVQLYDRLLRHIHDPEVQRLAHPGLVVRRLTPEIIRRVLAGPCRLVVNSDEKAARLFEGLRTEISLVRLTADGALEHHRDVRRAMLPMLEEDEPDKVAEIHQSAIAYFSTIGGVHARADEIYHRLAVGEDPETVDERWLEGVEEYLGAAIGELPARAQAYLAARIGAEIDQEAWASASHADVERRTEVRARDYLRLGEPQLALEALAVGKVRAPGSRLYLWEALAHRELGEHQAALATVQDALDVVPDRGTRPTMLAILELGASIEVDLDRRRAACEHIDAAYRLAKQEGDHGRTLGVAAQRLRIWRGRRKQDAGGFRRAAADAHEYLDTTSTEVLYANRDAAHRIAGELGAEYPGDLTRIAGAAGLPLLRPDRVQRALTLWNRDTKNRLEADAAARTILRAPELPSAAAATEVLVGLLGRHSLTKAAAGAIASEIRASLSSEE